MNIQDYWTCTLSQNAIEMRTFFHEEAMVYWHNTNEQFTADEFIKVNCEYPGNWEGELEIVEERKELIITALRVYSKDEPLSFHVVSFIRLKEDKIISIDEYWGDDTKAPKWRIDMHLGRKLK